MSYKIKAKYLSFISQDRFDGLQDVQQLIVRSILSGSSKIEDKQQAIMALIGDDGLIAELENSQKAIIELKQATKPNRTNNKKSARCLSRNSRRALFFLLNMLKSQKEYNDIEEPTIEDTEQYLGCNGLRLCVSDGSEEISKKDIENPTFDVPTIKFNRTITIQGTFNQFLHDYIIATQDDGSPIYSFAEGNGKGKFETNKGQMLYPSDWNPKSCDAQGRGFLFWGILVKAVSQKKKFVTIKKGDDGKEIKHVTEKRINKFFRLQTGLDNDYSHQNIGFDRRYADHLSHWLRNDFDKTISMLHDADVYGEFRDEIFMLMNGQDPLKKEKSEE